MTIRNLRDLPSMDHLLQLPLVSSWIAEYGRRLTLEALNSSLDSARNEYSDTQRILTTEELLEDASQALHTWTEPSLHPVINATGVILHTNLGRAPLSKAALKATQEAAQGYSNLEYDLPSGQRGSRLVHAETLLKHLTNAEAALVVNNNASAVLLVLSALARRRQVVISRTQLVEIGGGFRIPDVMKQSGAQLCEVGTTNRVHPADYSNAIDEFSPTLILHAHRSNFRITGFTSEPTLTELAEIAHQAGIPLVDDLGSGALLDTDSFGLAHEPTVYESLAAGADLVCFSGDKLLGGPQAGIIIGKLELINKLIKHPLARAIRADKLCLAALSATLLHYLKDEAVREIPIWKMINASLKELQSRAEGWKKEVGLGEVLPNQSTIGGGSLPEETLPTYVLALSVKSPKSFVERLRSHHPPIIARVEAEKVLFDPRTVFADQDHDLVTAILSSYSK
jgi:L-seryl-tRNA(Ser) seleniumtransferase